ncbi:hypothetical protein M0R04_09555 [Candidatus Dojkabacteria bacterium]|jgi:hypothetical protein|nr:hypothetical protein [Candidatus Dojkabacteria bacterium]
MQLFKQIIEKKLELSEECFVKRQYTRAIGHFYGAFNIALALTKTEDHVHFKREHAYKQFIVGVTSLQSHSFKKLQKVMNKDMGVILLALEIIESKWGESGYEFGEYYRPHTLGILSYEYPREN